MEAAGAAVLSELERTTVKAFLGVSALLWTGFGRSLLLTCPSEGGEYCQSVNVCTQQYRKKHFSLVSTET